MTSSTSEDGRVHVESGLMRESLVSKTLNEATESGRVRPMVPDVKFIAIGGQSIMDRGASAVLPLVDMIVELNQTYKIIVGVGGGARARHTFSIGLDLGLPIGGLARIMGGVEEQNRDMLQFLLAPHGGITFVKDHLQDLQMFLKGDLIPVCIGQPPYHFYEPPPEHGALPENGSDTGLFLMAELMGADQMIYVKDVDGLYREDPDVNPDAEFVAEATAAEVKSWSLTDLPIERNLLDCVENARLVQTIQLVNGLKPETLKQALAGQPVGTIIRSSRNRGAA